MKITRCRYCGSKLREIISLGTLPLVNYFPKKNEVMREKRYPLGLAVCEKCGLTQVNYLVPPKDIFLYYHYTTGASAPLIDKLTKLAAEATSRYHLTSKSRVVDIGSNDGTLLSAFKKRGIGVLGVEPARNLARTAEDRGIPTVKAFFSWRLAKKIRRRYGQFDGIFATHVLANVFDLADFMRGIKELLAPDGVCIIEVGYLGSMLEKAQFDAIYHEHYSYFSVRSLTTILADAGLTVVSASFLDAQGGSLCIVARHAGRNTQPIEIKEQGTGLDYSGFTKRVAQFRSNFLTLMRSFKGKTVVGFGAPAKAVTLLSYCGLGANDIVCIVDSTPVKQGRVLPGVHIPIVKESVLKTMKPDVVVVLAWNYQQEVMRKLRRLVAKKTVIVLPFPTLEAKRWEE